jgi:hypothetical protein
MTPVNLNIHYLTSLPPPQYTLPVHNNTAQYQFLSSHSKLSHNENSPQQQLCRYNNRLLLLYAPQSTLTVLIDILHRAKLISIHDDANISESDRKDYCFLKKIYHGEIRDLLFTDNYHETNRPSNTVTAGVTKSI